MFQMWFPSIIRSPKLHIERQVFVRPLLPPAASLDRPVLAAGSSIGLTNTWRCMCSFELLMMDRKTRLKHVQRLTEINKLWNIASFWLYSANILAMLEPMNVKLYENSFFGNQSVSCGGEETDGQARLTYWPHNVRWSVYYGWACLSRCKGLLPIGGTIDCYW